MFSARDLDHKYFVTSFFLTKVEHGGDNPERQLVKKRTKGFNIKALFTHLRISGLLA